MDKKQQSIVCNGLLSFFTTLAGLSIADGIPEPTKFVAAFWVAFITAAIAACTTWKEQLPPKSKAAAVLAIASLALPWH